MCQTLKNYCLDVALYLYSYDIVKTCVNNALVYYVEHYVDGEQKIALHVSDDSGDDELDNLLAELDDM